MSTSWQRSDEYSTTSGRYYTQSSLFLVSRLVNGIQAALAELKALECKCDTSTGHICQVCHLERILEDSLSCAGFLTPSQILEKIKGEEKEQ